MNQWVVRIYLSFVFMPMHGNGQQRVTVINIYIICSFSTDVGSNWLGPLPMRVPRRWRQWPPSRTRWFLVVAISAKMATRPYTSSLQTTPPIIRRTSHAPGTSQRKMLREWWSVLWVKLGSIFGRNTKFSSIFAVYRGPFRDIRVGRLYGFVRY